DTFLVRAGVAHCARITVVARGVVGWMSTIALAVALVIGADIAVVCAACGGTGVAIVGLLVALIVAFPSFGARVARVLTNTALTGFGAVAEQSVVAGVVVIGHIRAGACAHIAFRVRAGIPVIRAVFVLGAAAFLRIEGASGC